MVPGEERLLAVVIVLVAIVALLVILEAFLIATAFGILMIVAEVVLVWRVMGEK